MSSFIETLDEYFMLSNSIGTVINVLTELKNLNNYMRVHCDESSSQKEIQLKKLEQGIKEFRLLLVKYRFSQVEIGRVNTAISVPHQLCLGKLVSLQLEKIHLIVDEILTEAVKALKVLQYMRKLKHRDFCIILLRLKNLPQKKSDY